MKVILPANFYLMATVSLSVLMEMGMVVVFCYILEDIPFKLLSMIKNIGFFHRSKFDNKKKWLLSCSYNPTKMHISNHLAELSKGTDLYLTKYDQLLFLGDLMQELKLFLLKLCVLVIIL